VRNGRFAGRRFPSPHQCVTIYKVTTWNRGVLADNDDAVPLWIYANLASSSFFNDLFSAAEHYLKLNVADVPCDICEQQPCTALNADCYPKYGFARVPLPDSWLLSIRCSFPGPPIVGYRPRHGAPHQAPVGEANEPFNLEGNESQSSGEEGPAGGNAREKLPAKRCCWR